MELSRGRIAAFFTAFLFCLQVNAQDWPQFRGPQGDGKSMSTVPATWSDSSNLKWAVELPGRGVSSPIVVGDDVLVTAFSGEGANARPSGEASQLTRLLLCVDRKSGEIRWQRLLESNVAEDSYEGFLTDPDV
jgi:outer membrane protein assembly factor BamB